MNPSTGGMFSHYMSPASRTPSKAPKDAQLQQLEAALLSDPKNTNLHNQVADYAFSIRNFQKAYQHYQTSLREDPLQTELLLKMAISKYEFAMDPNLTSLGFGRNDPGSMSLSQAGIHLREYQACVEEAGNSERKAQQTNLSAAVAAFDSMTVLAQYNRELAKRLSHMEEGPEFPQEMNDVTCQAFEQRVTEWIKSLASSFLLHHRLLSYWLYSSRFAAILEHIDAYNQTQSGLTTNIDWTRWCVKFCDELLAKILDSANASSPSQLVLINSMKHALESVDLYQLLILRLKVKQQLCAISLGETTIDEYSDLCSEFSRCIDETTTIIGEKLDVQQMDAWTLWKPELDKMNQSLHFRALLRKALSFSDRNPHLQEAWDSLLSSWKDETFDSVLAWDLKDELWMMFEFEPIRDEIDLMRMRRLSDDAKLAYLLLLNSTPSGRRHQAVQALGKYILGGGVSFDGIRLPSFINPTQMLHLAIKFDMLILAKSEVTLRSAAEVEKVYSFYKEIGMPETILLIIQYVIHEYSQVYGPTRASIVDIIAFITLNFGCDSRYLLPWLSPLISWTEAFKQSSSPSNIGPLNSAEVGHVWSTLVAVMKGEAEMPQFTDFAASNSHNKLIPKSTSSPRPSLLTPKALGTGFSGSFGRSLLTPQKPTSSLALSISTPSNQTKSSQLPPYMVFAEENMGPSIRRHSLFVANLKRHQLKLLGSIASSKPSSTAELSEPLVQLLNALEWSAHRYISTRIANAPKSPALSSSITHAPANDAVKTLAVPSFDLEESVSCQGAVVYLTKHIFSISQRVTLPTSVLVACLSHLQQLPPSPESLLCIGEAINLINSQPERDPSASTGFPSLPTAVDSFIQLMKVLSSSEDDEISRKILDNLPMDLESRANMLRSTVADSAALQPSTPSSVKSTPKKQLVMPSTSIYEYSTPERPMHPQISDAQQQAKPSTDLKEKYMERLKKAAFSISAAHKDPNPTKEADLDYLKLFLPPSGTSPSALSSLSHKSPQLPSQKYHDAMSSFGSRTGPPMRIDSGAPATTASITPSKHDTLPDALIGQGRTPQNADKHGDRTKEAAPSQPPDVAAEYALMMSELAKQRADFAREMKEWKKMMEDEKRQLQEERRALEAERLKVDDIKKKELDKILEEGRQKITAQFMEALESQDESGEEDLSSSSQDAPPMSGDGYEREEEEEHEELAEAEEEEESEHAGTNEDNTDEEELVDHEKDKPATAITTQNVHKDGPTHVTIAQPTAVTMKPPTMQPKFAATTTPPTFSPLALKPTSTMASTAPIGTSTAGSTPTPFGTPGILGTQKALASNPSSTAAGAPSPVKAPFGSFNVGYTPQLASTTSTTFTSASAKKPSWGVASITTSTSTPVKSPSTSPRDLVDETLPASAAFGPKGDFFAKPPTNPSPFGAFTAAASTSSAPKTSFSFNPTGFAKHGAPTGFGKFGATPVAASFSTASQPAAAAHPNPNPETIMESTEKAHMAHEEAKEAENKAKTKTDDASITIDATTPSTAKKDEASTKDQVGTSSLDRQLEAVQTAESKPESKAEVDQPKDEPVVETSNTAEENAVAVEENQVSDGGKVEEQELEAVQATESKPEPEAEVGQPKDESAGETSSTTEEDAVTVEENQVSDGDKVEEVVQATESKPEPEAEVDQTKDESVGETSNTTEENAAAVEENQVSDEDKVEEGKLDSEVVQATESKPEPEVEVDQPKDESAGETSNTTEENAAAVEENQVGDEDKVEEEKPDLEVVQTTESKPEPEVEVDQPKLESVGETSNATEVGQSEDDSVGETSNTTEADQPKDEPVGETSNTTEENATTVEENPVSDGDKVEEDVQATESKPEPEAEVDPTKEESVGETSNTTDEDAATVEDDQVSDGDKVEEEKLEEEPKVDTTATPSKQLSPGLKLLLDDDADWEMDDDESNEEEAKEATRKEEPSVTEPRHPGMKTFSSPEMMLNMTQPAPPSAKASGLTLKAHTAVADIEDDDWDVESDDGDEDGKDKSDHSPVPTIDDQEKLTEAEKKENEENEDDTAAPSAALNMAVSEGTSFGDGDDDEEF